MSTRVVSWKDAALRKLSVSSEALVMPSKHRLSFGGLAAHLLDALVLFLELELVDLLAPEEAGIARFGDADLAEHLADDDLDVLVVDRHALRGGRLPALR